MKSKHIVIMAFVGMALVGALIWWHQKLKASAKPAESPTGGTLPNGGTVGTGITVSRPNANSLTPVPNSSTPSTSLAGGPVATATVTRN